jgi:hypothetical protein
VKRYYYTHLIGSFQSEYLGDHLIKPKDSPQARTMKYLDYLSEKVAAKEYSEVWALLAQFLSDSSVDDRIKRHFVAYFEKVQPRITTEEYIEIIKEHASHVLFEGLNEIDKRGIML